MQARRLAPTHTLLHNSVTIHTLSTHIKLA